MCVLENHRPEMRKKKKVARINSSCLKRTEVVQAESKITLVHRCVNFTWVSLKQEMWEVVGYFFLEIIWVSTE